MISFVKKILFPLFFTLLAFSGLFTLAHAQALSTYANPVQLLSGSGTPIDNIPDFLLAVVDMVFLIGMPIIVIFLIYSGFLFVTAGDNEAQTTKAKHVFLWTMLGAAILMGAKVIAAAIESTVLSLAP